MQKIVGWGGGGASGTAYEINHLLYSKVISVLKKKKSTLKLAQHPYTYKIPWYSQVSEKVFTSVAVY